MNHVTDYIRGFLLLFNPLLIAFFGAIWILKNVKKSVSNLLIIDAGQFCAISTDGGTRQ